jgi:hypothetical protein
MPPALFYYFLAQLWYLKGWKLLFWKTDRVLGEIPFVFCSFSGINWWRLNREGIQLFKRRNHSRGSNHRSKVTQELGIIQRHIFSVMYRRGVWGKLDNFEAIEVITGRNETEISL